MCFNTCKLPLNFVEMSAKSILFSKKKKIEGGQMGEAFSHPSAPCGRTRVVVLGRPATSCQRSISLH